MIQQVQAEVGSPFVSYQMDMWSSQNSKESYACMMASVIWRDPETSLFELRQFCLEFGCFPFIRHTANNVCVWIKRILRTWKLSPSDCVTATPDGAATMVRACILANLPVSVCDAHNLQRCVQYSTGHAGPGEGSNPECKEHIAEQRALVSVFNHSTKNQKLLKSAQGDAAHTPKQDSPTRWDGTFFTIQVNNVLEHAFYVVSEDPLAEVLEEDDEDDSATGLITSLKHLGFSDDEEEDQAGTKVDCKSFKLPDETQWAANRQLEAALGVYSCVRVS
jgi:hypothetical protein